MVRNNDNAIKWEEAMLLSFRIGREETLFLCESIILKMNSCLKKI